jgi:hypothetical protein
MNHVFLVDILKDVVKATAKALKKDITFEYGHYTDIIERIQAYSKNNKNVYPLICWFEDSPIQHGAEGLDGVAIPQMIILSPSPGDRTREQRETLVFRPILYPIYWEFLRQLKLSGKFQIYDETKIKHVQINRPHWGNPSLYKNEGYLFNQALDGIELQKLELPTYLKTC